MRVTITGGCGFIGSRLARRCVERDWDVTIFDNFSRFSVANLGKWAESMSIVQGDIEDRGSLKPALQGTDVVFHFGGISRAVGSIENPHTFFDINVVGTYNVYDLCRGTSTRIIFPSSWIVYSKEASGFGKKMKEGAKLDPDTPYGLSKLMGEEYARLYWHLYAEDIISVRLSNVYGPRDKDRIIPTMIDKALKGERLIVNGNPRFLNFIYVEDAVDALMMTAQKKSVKSRVFNIGTPLSTNLFDLATMIRKECDSSSTIEIGPLPQREFAYYCPNTSLAKAELGFVCKTDIVDGIRSCIGSLTASQEGETDSTVQDLQKSAPE
jgi:UDP-glucose 4-epimerase